MGALSAEAKEITERLRSQGVYPRKAKSGHGNHGQTLLRQSLTRHVEESAEYCSSRKPLSNLGLGHLAGSNKSGDDGKMRVEDVTIASFSASIETRKIRPSTQ